MSLNKYFVVEILLTVNSAATVKLSNFIVVHRFVNLFLKNRKKFCCQLHKLLGRQEKIKTFLSPKSINFFHFLFANKIDFTSLPRLNQIASQILHALTGCY